MENHLRQTTITLPELFLIAGTRALLGVGVGLLVAERMSEEQRKAVGWTLLGVGAVTTIPLAFEVLGGRQVQNTQLHHQSPEENFFSNRQEMI